MTSESRAPVAQQRPTDAIVIGGGIAGCTLAYELATRGLKTTIVEWNEIGSSSSGKNTGTLFTGPQPQVVELFDKCVEIYAEISAGPIKFEFGRLGHLLISETEENLAAAAPVAKLYEAAGVGMQSATGEELAREDPRLGLKVAGGYFVERAYTLEPMGATHAFAHAAREAGVTIRTGLRVAQIHTRGGKVEGILTDQGILSADLVFLANGIWMPELLRRTVGDGPLPPLPFSAGRGWLIQLGNIGFQIPWMIEELTWPDQEELGNRLSLHGLADLAGQKDDRPAAEAICFNPMLGGDARLGATIQPAFRDLLRNTDVPSRIAERALRMISGLDRVRVTNAYMGNRPMLSDGLPVAGRTPVEGLYINGGMGSIGMHAAPATSRWLAEAVLSGDGNPKQAWLRPTRFPGWSDC